MIERLRGRAGVAQRKRRLALHPVCAHCLAQEPSIVKATAIIDHIVPLAFGGSDEDDNTQGLCKYHNAIKTALEDSSREAATTHPLWLEPSRIPVTIVSGPPASGKTTYVEERADPATDIVIDMDAIARTIDPEFNGQWDRETLNRAMRRRNAILGSLKHAEARRAWFIVGAPTERERQWWRDKLGGSAESVFLDVSAEQCRERAEARRSDPRPIERYFKAAALSWRPPKPRRKKLAVDEDGYPIE